MRFRKEVLVVLFTLSIGGLFFFLPSNVARASSLYFSPSSVSSAPAQTFSISVRVNTEGSAINAVQGSIVFDSAKLEVILLSKTGSIFNLWTEEPKFSNTGGTISFEGGIPNPGYNGANGAILTLGFRTKSAGATEVSLVSGAVLANDGLGTNTLSSLGRSTIIISGSIAPAEPTNPPADPSTDSDRPTKEPSVQSTTHLDSSKWYANANPEFSWTLPAGVIGVSYIISDKETSNPGPNSDGLKNKVSYSDIPDGTHYFHIKFRQGGVWSPITHYRFNVDTVPPQEFEINLISAAGESPEITFSTTDTGSGIAGYEVKLGDADWTTVSADKAGSPYAPHFNQPGPSTVSVKAIDNAGNTRVASLPVLAPDTAPRVASTVGKFISSFFDKLINGLSANGLLIGFILAIIGFLVLCAELIREHARRTWRGLGVVGMPSVTKDALLSKTSKKLSTLADDMEEEVAFLNSIAKRRKLGSEEKYLKSKLERYLKQLDQIK